MDYSSLLNQTINSINKIISEGGEKTLLKKKIKEVTDLLKAQKYTDNDIELFWNKANAFVKITLSNTIQKRYMGTDMSSFDLLNIIAEEKEEEKKNNNGK